jgi:hypothetical protein
MEKRKVWTAGLTVICLTATVLLVPCGMLGGPETITERVYGKPPAYEQAAEDKEILIDLPGIKLPPISPINRPN